RVRRPRTRPARADARDRGRLPRAGAPLARPRAEGWSGAGGRLQPRDPARPGRSRFGRLWRLDGERGAAPRCRRSYKTAGPFEPAAAAYIPFATAPVLPVPVGRRSL